MSGPKHLWSGDWQQESEAAASSRAQRTARPAEPLAAEPATAKLPPRRPRRQLRRPRPGATTLVVAAAVLVLAGAAFGLSSLLGSSSAHPGGNHRASATAPTATVPGAPAVPTPATPPAQSNPQTQTNPQTSQVVATPMVNWLGMQIATQPPGAAVVQTVQIGSPADRAGINPGEIIEAVNGRSINSAQGIVAALKGLGRGARVTLQLAYGSGSSQAQLAMGASPSVAP
jgi:membrane-associated protease RseP (regulator of RpoE activity)